MERLSNLLSSDVASEFITKYDIEENDLLFLGIGEKVETVSFLFTTFASFIKSN